MAPVQSLQPKDAQDAAQSKAAKNQKLIKAALLHCFQSVAQHVIVIQSEPMLLKELCGGNTGEAARLLANASGLAGILGLFANQIGGKMSDVHGRKLFLMLGPLGNILCGSLVYLNPSKKMLVLACRVARLVMTTFSNTVIVGAAFGDALEPSEHKAAGMKLSAIIGAAVVVMPFLESVLLARLKHPRYTYLALAGLAATQTVSSGMNFPETLELAKRAKMATTDLLSTVNPFGFLSIYTRGSRALSGLTTISTFQLLLDGKNMSDIIEIWKRNHLGWSLEQSRNFIVIYGMLCVGSAAVVGEKLLKAMTNRQYTSFTNILNAMAFGMRGTTKSWMFILAILPMLPGVNGAATKAIATRCMQLVKQEKIGMGEYQAWSNNLRAIAGTLQPLLVGNYYAWCMRRGHNPGSVFWLLAFFGAVVPEIAMRFMSDAEVEGEGETTAKAKTNGQ